MAKKYTKKQFWELYKKLPQDLKDALFSEENDGNIYNIVEKNDAAEKHSEISENVACVLLGILPPNEFQETLEKELGIEKETAKKIAQEINRYVFYPVRTSLEKLYSMEIATPEKIKEAVPEKKPETATPRKDTYREPIS